MPTCPRAPASAWPRAHRAPGSSVWVAVWVTKTAEGTHSAALSPRLSCVCASEADRLSLQLPVSRAGLRAGRALAFLPGPAVRLGRGSACPVRRACFRWAGPASPNPRPGAWRTWTQCSASSCTGQCRPPCVPGWAREGPVPQALTQAPGDAPCCGERGGTRTHIPESAPPGPPRLPVGRLAPASPPPPNNTTSQRSERND